MRAWGTRRRSRTSPRSKPGTRTTSACGGLRAQLVYDTYTEAEGHVLAGGDVTVDLRADLRLAACYATDACREVAQWAHLAAGTTVDP